MWLIFCLLLWLSPIASHAASINVADSLGEQVLQFILPAIVLGLVPSFLIMATSFTRIIIVFSLLRSAIGLQQTPPNIVLLLLALFTTYFSMSTVIDKAYHEGMKPYIEKKIKTEDAIDKMAMPFHEFMLKQVGKSELKLFVDISKKKIDKPEDTPYSVLTPAFMISEMKKGFTIGFIIFLPFMVIDIAVSSILMSLGMMMLPPPMISLPLKVIFFALIDGWKLLLGNIIVGIANA